MNKIDHHFRTGRYARLWSGGLQARGHRARSSSLRALIARLWTA